jgi:hypothetical protein
MKIKKRIKMEDLNARFEDKMGRSDCMNRMEMIDIKVEQTD